MKCELAEEKGEKENQVLQNWNRRKGDRIAETWMSMAMKALEWGLDQQPEK